MDTLTSAIDLYRMGNARAAELACEKRLAAPALERAPDQLLVGVGAVGIRGVEEADAAVEGMRKNRHMPPKLVDAMGEMLQAIRDGKLARKPTTAVQEITGKAPVSFAAWCEAHKGAFL